MIFQTLTIARNTFVEAVRQPVLFLLVMVGGFAQFLNTWNTGFSMSQTESSQVTGDDKLLLDIGLASVFVLGTLAAGFLATAVMSREIENKTVLTIVSKPVSRVTLILGKFTGVAGAILLGVFSMLIFLLMGIRHGVMSTSADSIDGPVIVFSFAAIFLSIGVAGWCNYFYGWSFPQVAVTLLAPLMFIAYVLVLLVNDKWKIQPFYVDWKDQVVTAAACLVLAVLVLTAVATAASTRLGQVMTILICVGVFVASLLSNAMIGRRVFPNVPAAVIATAVPTDPARAELAQPGVSYEVRFEQAMTQRPQVGAPFYYSPNPSGFPPLSASGAAFQGNFEEGNSIMGAGVPSALVVRSGDARQVTVMAVGERRLDMTRPPETGDYVFTSRPETRFGWLMLWGAVPNLQFFWLIDAVSQNRPVPGSYLALAIVYSLTQIVAFLSLAVLLFQKRDVG